jgi:putative oxidoreductase
MKRLLSTSYTNTAFNLATFLLRATLAFLMCLDHGIPKLVHFSEWQHNFFDPLHIGPRWSLILVIVIEIFGSLLLILGLFSRIAAIFFVIEMAVVIFIFERGHAIENFEHAILFFAGFVCILLLGPGKISADAMTGR